MCRVFLKKKIYIYIFIYLLIWLPWVFQLSHVESLVWHAGWTLIYSVWDLVPNRDWTQVPCIGSVDSWPLGQQGSHWICVFNCRELNVCVSAKFMWWNLFPQVMVFGSGVFGRWLGHEWDYYPNNREDITEEPFHQTLNLPTPWSLISPPPELLEGEKTSVVYKPPTFGSLLYSQNERRH